MATSYNKFRKLIVTPILRLLGKAQTINSQSITTLQLDSSGNVTRAQGTVVVTDAGSGYAKGCVYVKTNATAGVPCIYQNIGTSSSCQFVISSVSGSTGLISTVSETITMVAGVGTLTFVPLAIQTVFVNPPTASVTGSFTVIPVGQQLLLPRQVTANMATGQLNFRSGDSVSQAYVVYVRT